MSARRVGGSRDQYRVYQPLKFELASAPLLTQIRAFGLEVQIRWRQLPIKQ
jgi:hypothetical protein